MMATTVESAKPLKLNIDKITSRSSVGDLEPPRRPSLSARVSKSTLREKGNAIEQLALAAEAIRAKRGESTLGGGSDNSIMASRPPSRLSHHVRKRSLSMSELPDAMKRQLFRLKVEEELRSTEEAYVRDLELVKTRVIDPLSKREILTKEEKNILFSNLRQLLDLHLHLMTDLRKTDKPWEPFAKMSAFFKLYIAYSSSHGAASNLACTLQKTNPAFAALVSDALSTSDQKLRLEDYLIKPIQRICKYPLLFNELQRYTDTPHCVAIVDVAKKMSEVAEVVNAAQRRQDSVPRLVEIAQAFDTNGRASFSELIAPDRHYVREQQCEVLLENGSSEQLLVLLFSDMILLTRSPSVLRKKYELKQEVQLSPTVKASPVEGGKAALVITDDKRTLFTMRGLTLEETKEWVKQIAQTTSKLSASPRLVRM